jgi:hypothetical protein
VNLLIDRCARSVEVESRLPFAGRVQLRTLAPRSLTIRIPGWVGRNSMTVTIGKRQLRARMAGNFLVLPRLRAKETVAIEFDLPRHAETYELEAYDTSSTAVFDAEAQYPHQGQRRYTLDFVASAAVKIEPQATSGYRLYERVSPVAAERRPRRTEAPPAGKRIPW